MSQLVEVRESSRTASVRLCSFGQSPLLGSRIAHAAGENFHQLIVIACSPPHFLESGYIPPLAKRLCRILGVTCWLQ
jgi:hypothetical protein